MAALVRHIRSFRAAIVFSLRIVGYGDWSWWQKTPWTTTPWVSRLPSELPSSVSKTPRPELLFGCRYGSDKLGVPTLDYCFLISTILGVNGRLLPFASYRSMVTSISIVAVVLATRHPRIAEWHFLLPLPV